VLSYFRGPHDCNAANFILGQHGDNVVCTLWLQSNLVHIIMTLHGFLSAYVIMSFAVVVCLLLFYYFYQEITKL